MIGFGIVISYLFLALSLFFGFYRLFRGPSTLDRILAFDTLCIVIIGIVIVYSIQKESVFFLEMILIFSLLGFTSTIAFLDYLLTRGKKEEKKS